MPKVYCTSPMVGTGTEEDPYRPAIADLDPPISWIGCAADGAVAGDTMFCLVDIADIVPLNNKKDMLTIISAENAESTGKAINPHFNIASFGIG